LLSHLLHWCLRCRAAHNGLDRLAADLLLCLALLDCGGLRAGVEVSMSALVLTVCSSNCRRSAGCRIATGSVSYSSCTCRFNKRMRAHWWSSLMVASLHSPTKLTDQIYLERAVAQFCLRDAGPSAGGRLRQHGHWPQALPCALHPPQTLSLCCPTVSRPAVTTALSTLF